MSVISFYFTAGVFARLAVDASVVQYIVCTWVRSDSVSRTPASTTGGIVQTYLLHGYFYHQFVPLWEPCRRSTLILTGSRHGQRSRGLRMRRSGRHCVNSHRARNSLQKCAGPPLRVNPEQLTEHALLPTRTVRNALTRLEDADLVTAQVALDDVRKHIHAFTVPLTP